mmetsp:Transcript_16045/g.50422  ORF Transcript_16045/g.50422 Transcript_16045/m.50422 type:complete len:142 (+) Transcript_16045:77-502(+)
MSAVKGKVLGAAGLKNVDLWGKSDPFVKVTLEAPDGSIAGEMKTATKTDDLNPTWEDESFNFSCGDGDFMEHSLRFRIWDTGLGPDVELGEVLLPLKLVPIAGADEEATVYNFSLGVHKGKKSLGKLSICAKVVPKPGLFG